MRQRRIHLLCYQYHGIVHTLGWHMRPMGVGGMDSDVIRDVFSSFVPNQTGSGFMLKCVLA